jgi:predicted ArsR family transcriptional regulator
MTVREQVWNLMQQGVHLTADEIAGALDLPVLSVRPRVCELARANKLKPSGTKKNRRGNTMTIWTRE